MGGMRTAKPANEELRQKILELLAIEAKPLSQPEIAEKLGIKQAKVWQMLSGMLIKNMIVSISKSQNPEQFGEQSKVAYLFRIPSQPLAAIRQGGE